MAFALHLDQSVDTSPSLCHGIRLSHLLPRRGPGGPKPVPFRRYVDQVCSCGEGLVGELLLLAICGFNLEIADVFPITLEPPAISSCGRYRALRTEMTCNQSLVDYGFSSPPPWFRGVVLSIVLRTSLVQRCGHGDLAIRNDRLVARQDLCRDLWVPPQLFHVAARLGLFGSKPDASWCWRFAVAWICF